MANRNGALGHIFAAGLAAASFAVLLGLWLRSASPELGYNTLRLLPDLALLVALLIVPAVLAMKAPRISVAFAVAVCAAWLVALCSQLQFFLHTGYFASRPLISYAAFHWSTIHSVATSGLDTSYGLRVLGALACVGLACYWGSLRSGLEKSKVAVGAASAALLSSFLFVPPSIGALSGPLWNSGFSNDLPPVLSPKPQYVAPVLTSPSSTRQLPNVVLLIVESGRADLLDVGNAAARPPFLNKLAREAVSFDRAYTTTTHTSKALIGILCGHYPHPRMEILEANPGAFPLKCLPHLLEEAGYTTHFLQAALGAFENRPGLTANLGFQTTIVQEDLPPEFRKAGYFGMDERALLDALPTVASKAKEGPVFITLLTNLTHHPYAMPGQRAPSETAPAAYGTAVEYVDEFLADAYERMGESLDWNNTLLIVLGDHGEAFMEHGLQQHDSVSYEEVVRIPLLIRYPGRLAPRVEDKLTQTVDLFPSILELLGLKWSGTIAGQSVLAQGPREPVVTNCWPTRTCHAVVFESGLKVVFYFGDRKEEVYDLRRDRWERANLVSAPGADELIFQAAKEIARARHWAEAPYVADQAVAGR